LQCLAKLVGSELHILEIGFADGFSENSGDFAVAYVALSLQLVNLTAGKIEPRQRVSGELADVPRGDQRKLEFRAQWTGDRSHLRDGVSLSQCIFHKIGGANMQDIESGNLIEPFFEVVQADDRSSLVWPISADTAERNHVLHAVLFDRGGKGLNDLFCAGEIVVDRGIGREH